MSIHKKTSIEKQKQAAAKNLAIRLDLLKSKGWDDKRIQKDAKVKQYQAQRREYTRRLTGIAAMEALASQKVEIKAQKIEAIKSAPPKIKKKKAAPEAPQKAKKERKVVVTAED